MRIVLLSTPSPAAYGQIQADSSYRLKTGSGAGLALGEYVVTVVATEPAAASGNGVAVQAA